MANTTDWLNISAQSGSSGTTRLTLTARRNTSLDYKQATITAYNPVYNITAKTYVTLESYTPYLAVSPTQLGVPASGGTYELAISGNCEWVIAFPDMVSSYSTSAGTGDTVVTFTIPATQCATTVVGNIVVTDETGQISRLCRIEQYAEPISILYNPQSLTFPYYGGPLSFSVSANCLYSIASGQGDWYTFTPTTGTSGETDFTVSAASINSGNTDWTGTINIVGPEGVAAVLMLTQLNQGQYSINYTADTSTIDYSGETRTITIDATDFINSSITVTILDAPDVTYTYQTSGLTRGIITLTIPQNPGGERNFKVVVSGRRAMSQNYSTAAIQYTQAALQLDFVTDTSNVRGSGEVRTITILNSNINPNRTGLNLPSDFPQQGSYTVSGNVITLTYPANPSSSASRTWTIGVLAQTNDGVSLSGSYHITQDANVTYSIPYTADTSTVNETGETRTITIDTSNLISSSITVGVVGATGITATYYNGTVTVVFPENYGPQKNVDITINAQTNGGDVAEATISYTQDSGDIHNMPLRFNITNAGNIYWFMNSSSDSSATIQYRINKGSWTTITSTTGAGAYFSVNTGDIVEFIGDNANYRNNRFASTCNFTVAGNIMSLINSTGYSTLSAFTANNAFASLFNGCTGLTSAESLLLPATALTSTCYAYMFSRCTSLTTAPELPATTLAYGCYNYMFVGCTSLTTAPTISATTLANYCYNYMFSGCTSLTSAPVLSATTLAGSCYFGMFQSCTSLTTAPALPATTLADWCYSSMFNGCRSLTTAPALPATTLAYSCYDAMFYGCTGLTTAPELPATTLAYDCYSSMFFQCTSLTTAPELPATTLATGCYRYMFQGCTSLTSAPSVLPATTLANSCYNSMFVGCRSLTRAPELPAKVLVSSCYDSMFMGCSNLNYIKCFATDISASRCTYYWVSGVAPTGTFVKSDSMEDWQIDSVNGIPIGWTVEDEKDYFEYLSFNIISGGTIMWKAIYSGFTRTIEYKKNDGEWTTITSNTGASAPSISVSVGDVIQFRGDNAAYCNSDISYNSFSGSTAKFEVEGNIMSLIDSENFATATTLASIYTFSYLFGYCTGLISAESLVLPATTLAQDCYYRMFYRCTSLTTAPELPATTLAEGCYAYMFSNCTNLTTAPVLSATTLASYCYDNMFEFCTSLTSAPALPATTLTEQCYSNMFNGCTSLKYIKCLATNISASNCTTNWVNGVAGTGTFVTPSSTNWTTGNNGIPSGWTRVNA